MIGEPNCAVEHARHEHVVDVVLVAESQLGRLVASGARADATGYLDLGSVDAVPALGQKLDRVEDLQVSGASAQVSSEVTGRLVGV